MTYGWAYQRLFKVMYVHLFCTTDVTGTEFRILRLVSGLSPWYAHDINIRLKMYIHAIIHTECLSLTLFRGYVLQI